MRAIVRLKLFNDCPDWMANIPQQQSLGYSLIKLNPTIRDGEHKFPFEAGLIRRGLVGGNGIHEIIQRRPEVVQIVPDDKTPTLKRRGFIDPENQTKFSVLRICLFDEAIGVSLKIGTNLILDGLSVYLTSS